MCLFLYADIYKLKHFSLQQGGVAIDTLEPIFNGATTSRAIYYIKIKSRSSIMVMLMTLNEKRLLPHCERDKRVA